MKARIRKLVVQMDETRMEMGRPVQRGLYGFAGVSISDAAR